MIEFDVRLSSDGVPVVFHDDRTGRTAKENLAVARTPAARLRTVRLKNGERFPFLADVLEIVGGRFRSTSNRSAADRGGGQGAIEGGLPRGTPPVVGAARRVPRRAGPSPPRSRAGWSPAAHRHRISPSASATGSPRSTRPPSSHRAAASEGRSVRRPAPAVHGRRPGEGVRPDRRRCRRRLLQPLATLARSLAESLKTPFPTRRSRRRRGAQ